jgi:hypothetical protein
VRHTTRALPRSGRHLEQDAAQRVVHLLVVLVLVLLEALQEGAFADLLEELRVAEGGDEGDHQRVRVHRVAAVAD